MMTVLQVALIILAAGILGGTVNFALARSEASDWKSWAWAVVTGIGAAFLVPLFLNTISSRLLTDLLGNDAKPADGFVFAGFCLLGAIVSRAMIQTLAQRVLQVAETALAEVAELQQEVAPIIDKETELEDEAQAGEGIGDLSLTDEVTAVLKALEHHRFSLRSATGIARDVGRKRTEVVDDLGALVAEGLAAEVQGKKGLRWAVGPRGRAYLADA